MVAYATEKFRNDNPKTYAAYVAALRETIDYINKDPAGATKDYLEVVEGTDHLGRSRRRW